MPKLILLAACEKVVIDQNDNTTSLISLLEAIQVSVPESERDKLPEDAGVPVNWSLLALWQVEAGDKNKQFESRFVVRFSKVNQLTLDAPSFKFEEGKPNFRNLLRITGLPLKPLLGIDLCPIQAYIRAEGAEEWGEPVGSFPIIIRQLPQPPSPDRVVRYKHEDS